MSCGMVGWYFRAEICDLINQFVQILRISPAENQFTHHPMQFQTFIFIHLNSLPCSRQCTRFQCVGACTYHTYTLIHRETIRSDTPLTPWDGKSKIKYLHVDRLAPLHNMREVHVEKVHRCEGGTCRRHEAWNKTNTHSARRRGLNEKFLSVCVCPRMLPGKA